MLIDKFGIHVLYCLSQMIKLLRNTEQSLGYVLYAFLNSGGVFSDGVCSRRAHLADYRSLGSLFIAIATCSPSVLLFSYLSSADICSC